MTSQNNSHNKTGQGCKSNKTAWMTDLVFAREENDDDERDDTAGGSNENDVNNRWHNM